MDELDMRFDEDRAMNRATLFFESDRHKMRSASRIWIEPETNDIHVQMWMCGCWFLVSMLSIYVIRLSPVRRMDQPVQRRFLAGINYHPPDCVICGCDRPLPTHFLQAIRTSERFAVCRLCVGQTLNLGVMCIEGDRQIYSEVVDIDEL
jgi:hypothetical protein